MVLSPALRRRRLCFFHNRIRRERAANRDSLVRFDLPLLEDANSVQMALMHVIQRLGSGTVDHKTAGLMLYALQTASINLRHTSFEPSKVTHVVIDRDTVHATCINGPQWFEEDFEADAEEDETEDDVAEKDEGGDDDAEHDPMENDESENAEEIEDEAVVAESSGNAVPSNLPANSESGAELPSRKKPKAVTAAEAHKQVQNIAREFLLEAIAQKAT